MAVIRFKRGTRAQLDAAAGTDDLHTGEPYLVTDEDVLAVGTGTDSYVDVGAGGGGPALDATGVDEGYVPTADGADGWAWAEAGGGGVQDTGPRNISSLIVHPGMSASPSPLVLQRVGATVFLSGPVYVAPGTSLTLGNITAATPEGFRPSGDPAMGTFVPNDLSQVATHTTALQVWRDYGVYLQSVVHGPTTSGSEWVLQAIYLTNDPWPETLPGVPV